MLSTSSPTNTPDSAPFSDRRNRFVDDNLDFIKFVPKSNDPVPPPASHSFASLLRHRRRQLGLSLAALADLAGCTKGYLSAIETGTRPAPPSPAIIAALESALTLKPGDLALLAHWHATPGAVKEAVAQMNHKFAAQQGAARALAAALRSSSLDDLHKRGDLRRLIDRIDPSAPPTSSPSSPSTAPASSASAQTLHPIPHPHSTAPSPLSRLLPIEVPLINSVAAGYPTEFTDLGYPARVADAYVRTPDIHDPDAFAARVVGDSMAPLYQEGDIVVFSPAKPIDPASGTDCFVRLEPDHESTFKRVYFETDSRGTQLVRLQPLNPNFPPRTLPRDQIAGCYPAVSVTRTL